MKKGKAFDIRELTQTPGQRPRKWLWVQYYDSAKDKLLYSGMATVSCTGLLNGDPDYPNIMITFRHVPLGEKYPNAGRIYQVVPCDPYHAVYSDFEKRLVCFYHFEYVPELQEALE